MQSAHKIMRLCRKWGSHCTKWKVVRKYWYHPQNYGVTTQNEKVECKILIAGKIMESAHKMMISCRKWCNHRTKWKSCAQNILFSRKILKWLHKMMISCRKWCIHRTEWKRCAQNIEIVQKIIKSLNKIMRSCRKWCSHHTK